LYFVTQGGKSKWPERAVKSSFAGCVIGSFMDSFIDILSGGLWVVFLALLELCWKCCRLCYGQLHGQFHGQFCRWVLGTFIGSSMGRSIGSFKGSFMGHCTDCIIGSDSGSSKSRYGAVC